MTQPAFELADIDSAQGSRFLERYRSGMDFQQRKAFRAILNCRTSALGGHVDICPQCGYETHSFNSCRNRSCPKCQAGLRRGWIAARKRAVLGTSHFHVVFTVPQELNWLALESQRLFYSLLFTAGAATTLEVAADPKHLGAEIGILSILHTWGQNLLSHPHIHGVIPQGGLAPDHQHRIRPRYRFFLPKKVLSRVFRGKFLAGLKRLLPKNQLRCTVPPAALSNPKQFAQLLRKLHRHDWVVDVRLAFGGPMQVIRYLWRYTHRVAISTHRLLNFDGERVTFLCKGYAHNGKQGKMARGNRVLAPILSARIAEGLRTHPQLRISGESISRQTPHTLPRVLSKPGSSQRAQTSAPLPEPSTWLCPNCGTTMVIVLRFTVGEWPSRGNFVDN